MLLENPKIQIFLKVLAKEVRSLKPRAIDEALARLGDPVKLGRSLRKSHRPWYFRWFVLVPTSFAVLSVVAVSALTYTASIYLQRAEEIIQEQEASLKLFFKDQESLKKYPFLLSNGRKSDAGSFLNPHILWEGIGGGKVSLRVSSTLGASL